MTWYYDGKEGMTWYYDGKEGMTWYGGGWGVNVDCRFCPKFCCRM